MGNGKEGSDNAVGLFWPNHFRQLTVAERCEGNGHFGDLQRGSIALQEILIMFQVGF